MTVNKALFMVQSPLHIHNAREAIIEFFITHPTFLVVTSTHNAKWAEMMIADLPVNANSLFCERNDFDLDECTRDYAQHIPFLKKQSFDYVFFSDSRLYIFVDIVKSLQNKNTYLMDDGVGIIQTVSTLKKTGKYFDVTQSSQLARRNKIEKIKKKYNLWQLESVKYDLFTAFDFESCDKFNVVQNSMKQLCFTHKKLNYQKVIIFGVPFVKHGYMTSESYCSYLIQIKQYYKGKIVHYFPHPREEEKDFVSLVKKTGLNLILTDLGAEQYLGSLPVPPHIICGFYSAALWYIAKYQPDIQVDAHRIDPDDICLSPTQLMTRSSHLTILDIMGLVYDYYRLRMNVIMHREVI